MEAPTQQNIQDAPTRIRQNMRVDRPLYPSDAPEAQKVRNEKRKSNPTSQRGRIEFVYKEEQAKIDLFNKMDKIKLFMGEGKFNKVSSFEMLHRVMDYFISSCLPHVTQPMEVDEEGVNNEEHHEQPCGTNYHYADKIAADEQFYFVCTTSAIENVVSQAHHHAVRCNSSPMIKNTKRLRHAVHLSFTCANDHSLVWTSSPHAQNGKLLVNLRLAHGYLSSGMLPNQYQKLCEASGIGILSEKYLGELQKEYAPLVKEEAEESADAALFEEIAYTTVITKTEEELFQGISILTDARHCWRKNAKFSDVVCIGSGTHKVLRIETVDKRDDASSQRHELLGVKRIYNFFEEKSCPIKIHAHDTNASVSKFVRTEQKPTQIANDTWHLTKGITQKAKKITKGEKKKRGVTWHEELADKAAAIKTHVFWSMKFCDGNAKKLRSNILNLVEHYKGNHTNCFETSRCRTDEHYEPSKYRITDSSAEMVLVTFLKKLKVYKFAERYKYCLDTHYVESFNNALLQYHDKRIVYGRQSYDIRTNLALLDWNENVNRGHTSVREVQDALHPRRINPIPVLSAKTYNFKDSVWRKWLNKIYST